VEQKNKKLNTVKLKQKDILDNSIYYDQDSIGLAIINNETASLAFNKLKQCVSNPTVIIKKTEQQCIYFSLGKPCVYLNVTMNNNEWYVQDISIDKNIKDLVTELSKNMENILYINDKLSTML
jgi:hypothetical protein